MAQVSGAGSFLNTAGERTYPAGIGKQVMAAKTEVLAAPNSAWTATPADYFVKGWTLRHPVCGPNVSTA